MTATMSMDPRIAARRDRVEREEHRRRTRRALTVAAVFLVAAIGAVVAQSSLLAVDRVTVTGTTRITPERVVEVAGVREGTSLLTLDLARARRSIVELPWVAEVSSHRSWSGEVTFTVVERTPAAAVTAGDWWAVVDADGRVLEVEESRPADLEPVVGITAPAVAGEWLDGDLTGLVVVAEGVARDAVVGAAARQVTVDDQGAIVVDLEQGGRVVVGDQRQLEDKLTALRTFLLDVDLTCMATLDVRAPSAPVLRRSC